MPELNDHAEPNTPAAKKPIGKTRLRLIIIALLVVLAATAGYTSGRTARSSLENKPLSLSSTASEQKQALENQGQLISTIAKTVGESVVSVEVTSQSSYGGFFGINQYEEQGAGTGIILSKEGLVITNRHVVPAGTTKVSVTLSDGTKLDNVEVVGRTTQSDPLDIAFLKIKDTKGKQLVPAKIGDSSKVQVGDTVVAIGNALGQFQNTVTSGIISGYGRQIQASDGRGSARENLDNLFQTDAAINSGNSGGPLVNISGEVIGINTAAASGTAENIGFAIPINDVAGLIKSVSDKGKLERPYLGTVFIPITADIAKYYELKSDKGAYIPTAEILGSEPVISGGPADKAGLKAGDIITKVNDDTIDAQHGLTSLLGKYQPNDKVKLNVVRGDQNLTLEVTLGTAPSE